MSLSSISGVDRAALIDAILRVTAQGVWSSGRLADVVIAHIAEHHECHIDSHIDSHIDTGAECHCGSQSGRPETFRIGWQECDREHADEWVEVDEGVWDDLPDGTRFRWEWVKGAFKECRLFVHRDDLPDPDAEAANALRDASWNVPRLADGSRPDPLPGLPEARGLLAALREAGWAVVREESR